MQSLSDILPSVAADIKFRFSRRHYPDEINEMIQIEYDEKLMHYIVHADPLRIRYLGHIRFYIGGGYERGIKYPFISAFRGPYPD